MNSLGGTTLKGERSILSIALDTTEIQQKKKKNCSMLSFGRPTGHFMTRETVEEQKPESVSLWILHCNQYRPSSWARKIMSHKKIMIFISRMIITDRKHKPLLSRMRIASLWVTVGRCEPIRTPSDTGVLHCAQVCATHLRLHWHPYRRSKTLHLQRSPSEVTDEVKSAPRWSFKASQHNTECRFHLLLHKEGYTESAGRSPILTAYLKTQRAGEEPFDQRLTQAIAHSSSDLEWGRSPFWFNADPFYHITVLFLLILQDLVLLLH